MTVLRSATSRLAYWAGVSPRSLDQSYRVREGHWIPPTAISRVLSARRCWLIERVSHLPVETSRAARRPLEGFENVQVERHRMRDDFKAF